MLLHKFHCVWTNNMALKVISSWPLWIFMSMEFLIQQLKSQVTFGSAVFFSKWLLPEKIIWSTFFFDSEWNIAKIKILTDSVSHEVCDLLTCNPQYFQDLVLNFCNLWSFQEGKGRKMALTSLNVYTSHPLRQMSFYISRHGLPVTVLEAAIPLVHWKVNLRWPSVGCHQIQTMQCNKFGSDFNEIESFPFSHLICL